MYRKMNNAVDMANDIRTDSEIYRVYSELVNANYPLFLNKYGINNSAIKAEDAVIVDSYGKEYIDCVSGFGLFSIGHNRSRIIMDLITQLKKNQLVAKPLISKIQVEASEKLAQIAPENLNCSFLCNSGSEAIDSAIKLARLYTGKSEIITANNSFHGITYGALSATGIKSFNKFFTPLVPNIIQVDFADIAAIRENITPDTAAILLEPMQHEAGMHIPKGEYFREVRDLCNYHNILLILDEIKTGMGRTGMMFCCNHFGIVPDILVIGKALGGGLIPIGAIISVSKIWQKFSLSFPMAATSFGGNIFACRALLSTIEIIQEDKLVAACMRKGNALLAELQLIVHKYSHILKNIEGKGLLIGIKVKNAQIAFAITKKMIQNGILLLPAYGDRETIIFEPPFVITNDQLQKVIYSFDTICGKV